MAGWKDHDDALNFLLASELRLRVDGSVLLYIAAVRLLAPQFVVADSVQNRVATEGGFVRGYWSRATRSSISFFRSPRRQRT